MKAIVRSLLLAALFAFPGQLLAQQTYTWAVASGDFDAAGSWSPSRSAPATNDILVFNGSIQSAATVTNLPSRETIGQLIINNSCAVTFSPATVTGTAGTGTASRASAIVTGTGGTTFTSTFMAGDIITIGTTSAEVATVTSATSLTTVSTGTIASSSYTICPRITISGGSNALSIATGSSLIISGTLPTVLYVATGSTGSISGSLTFSNATHRLNVNDAGGVTFNSGSIFTQGTAFAGNAFEGAGTGNTVIFASGSTCSVAAGSNPFALTAPASKVTFNSGSLFKQTSGAPSFSGRTYADFTLSTGNLQSVTGGSAVSINNLTVTANSTLTWGMTGNPTPTGHAIKGNITVDAGSTLNFTPASAGTVTLSGSALQTITSTNAIGISSFATVINGNAAGIVFTPSTLVTIAGTLNLNGNPLTLQSSLAGTASIGTVTGTLSGATNVTAERYLADKRAWRLIAPSVYSTQNISAAWQEGAGGTLNNPTPGYGTFIIGSSTANGFDVASSSGSLLAYNGTAFNSVPNTNATAVSLNPGYFLFSIGDRGVNPATAGVHGATTLRSNGTVVTGTQTATVTAAGFTLVGNPYPAAVDFGNVTKSATVPDQFYAWDINLGTYGGYVLVSKSGASYTSVPTSPSGLTNVIPSGAAVFVQSDGSTVGSLTINESSKAIAAGSGSFSNFVASVSANAHNLRVNLTDASSNLVDGVMATYGAGNSNKVDQNDASKLPNFYENISLSRSGKQLTLERRSDITVKDTLFIQLSGVKATTYQLQVNPNEFDEPGMVAYLDDAFLHTHTKLDLTQVSNIAFTTTADTTSYKNRFQISLIPETPTIVTKISHIGASVIAYPNPITQKQVSLSFDGLPAGTYNVTVVNTFGQVMQRNSMTYNGSEASKILAADYSTGMYTINIQAAGYNQSIKVIIP